MIVLTNLCMHQQCWQPPQTEIKSLSSRESRGAAGKPWRREGHCKAGVGSLNLGELGGWWGWNGARKGGALAELGVINDVQQLFVASSLMAHFSLQLEFNHSKYQLLCHLLPDLPNLTHFCNCIPTSANWWFWLPASAVSHPSVSRNVLHLMLRCLLVSWTRRGVSG